MEEEDEVLNILNKALNGMLGAVENLSTISDVDQLRRARNYVPNVQSSTERFALILEYSCFEKSAILKPSIDLKNANVKTHLGLKVHTASFAQAKIPACYEIIAKILDGEM